MCAVTVAEGIAFGDGRGLGSLLAAMVVVAAAPIVVAFLPGRVPQVVLLIAGGIVIGPEMLDLARPDDITLFANLGLGFLFLLAGYELDPALLRERAGKLAIVAWVISIVLAIATVGALEAAGLVKAFVPVAIGLTTTALGTLLPILRDHHMLEGRFGRSLVRSGRRRRDGARALHRAAARALQLHRRRSSASPP